MSCLVSLVHCGYFCSLSWPELFKMSTKYKNIHVRKAPVNMHRKSLSLAMKLDVNPAQILRSFRLTGIDSTVCFEK